MTVVPDTYPTQLRPGLVLDGRYELLSFIGAGGMAQVWRASQIRLGRTVAVKVLLPTLADDGEFRRRFDSEGVTVAKLRRHPHIVSVIDSGTDQGHMFIVMDYIAGETLEDRLRSAPAPMSGAEVLDMLEPIASAIDLAHQHELVHRDIKPANILIEEHTDHPFLADFGIAKDWNAGTLTNTRNAFATLRYSSPEFLRGEQVQAPADIYSLALVAYEALTGGEGPYIGMDDRRLFSAHVWDSPLALLPAGDPSSAAAHEVLSRALAKKPDERTPTATELVRELRTAIGHQALDRRPAYASDRPVAAPAPVGDWTPGTAAAETADLGRPRPQTAEIPDEVSDRLAEVAFMEEVSGDTADLPILEEPKPEQAAPKPPRAPRRQRRQLSAPAWWPAAIAAPLLALPLAAFLTRPDTPQPVRLSAGNAQFEARPGARAATAAAAAAITKAAFPLTPEGKTIALGTPAQGLALTTVDRGRVALAPDDGGDGRLIKIAGGQARRYETPRRTIVIAQTAGTALWLGCRHNAGDAASDACERAIATLQLKDEQLQGDPLPALAKQLTEAQRRPAESRARLTLPVRDLPRRADRAASIANAYASATTSVRKLASQRARDPDLQQLADALDDTRAAYRRISQAARDRSAPGDREGRQQLERADRAVDTALKRFHSRGYTIGTPTQ